MVEPANSTVGSVINEPPLAGARMLSSSALPLSFFLPASDRADRRVHPTEEAADRVQRGLKTLSLFAVSVRARTSVR